MTTTVTLDTNVVQEYWRQGARVAIVEALIDLAEDELINLAVTRRIYEDVPHPPLADRISKLDEIGVVSQFELRMVGKRLRYRELVEG